MHRGWYGRGYLSHCDQPSLFQAITSRLADSLPAAGLEQMDAGLHPQPLSRRDGERRRKIEDWLDAGQGCCAVRIPEVAACVADTWQHFAGERYGLIVWVVTSNQAHALIRVREGGPLGKIVQSWKGYAGRQIWGMMEGWAEQGLGGPREGWRGWAEQGLGGPRG